MKTKASSALHERLDEDYGCHHARPPEKGFQALYELTICIHTPKSSQNWAKWVLWETTYIIGMDQGRKTSISMGLFPQSRQQYCFLTPSADAFSPLFSMLCP